MDSARSGGAAAMNSSYRFLSSACLRISFLSLIFLAAFGCELSLAQTGVYQQTFPVSVAEAKAALQTVSATSRGRLPTLEGFVQPGEEPMDRYDKGYYECTFQVLAAVGGGTIVRATAKVTAWYSDADAARSGYRVLVSNGRLESDALDRVAEKLSPRAQNGSIGTTAIIAPTPPSPKAAASNAAPPSGDALVPLRLGSASAAIGAATKAPHVTPDAESNPPSGMGAESVKAQQAANERKSLELSNYIKNLEEIQRNQSHPADLAAVKNSKTPVFAKPAENTQVLLNADAQDEFPILGVDGTWVHVQISGLSRGWIRRSQLEMPSDFAASAASPTENHSAHDVIFKVANEQTIPFSGSWEPLKGKIVRIEWIQPANPATSTSKTEKLAFAKSVILKTYEKMHESTQPAEGIVVVFDSADGGQIEATLSSVKGLASRGISDAVFWRQCSLDPRESFLDSAKP
jgi:hypothetical protein